MILTLLSGKPKVFEKVYPQQSSSSEGVFENGTHIQFEKGNDILQKPNLYVYMNLVKDTEGFGFSRDPYKYTDNLVLL